MQKNSSKDAKPRLRVAPWAIVIILFVVICCLAGTILVRYILNNGVNLINTLAEPNQETSESNLADKMQVASPFVPTAAETNVSDADKQPIVEQAEKTAPLPENFPSNWAEMTQEEQEMWVTEAFFGVGESKYFTRIEEKDGVGTGFAFQVKSVGSNEVPCASGFTCHFDLDDGNVIYAYDIEESVTDVIAGTVRIPSLIQVLEGIDVCTLYYKAWTFDTSNGVEVTPMGAVAQCATVPTEYSELVDTEIGQRVAEVSEMTGVAVISVGHIADGKGVFDFYSGDMASGDITPVCPSNFTCFVTRSNESWVEVQGDGQKIPGVVGIYFFDQSRFLNETELMEFAHQLMGDNISEGI